MKKPKNVDEYTKNFPKNIQKKIKEMRAAVREAAPQAQESISYGMPYYSLNGRLLYFAVHTNHLGFYPLTSAIKKFKDELKNYEYAKGSIQFPYDKPLPLSLIKKMVRFRVSENLGEG